MKQSTVLGHGSSEHLDNLKEKRRGEQKFEYIVALADPFHFHDSSGGIQALPGQVVSMIYPVENIKKRRIESGF